jgi:iron complex transport system permease protein
MGINSGAGLFVLLSGICFPHVYTARNAAAFAGALLSALLVFLIARKAGMSKSVIVLSGVAVSSMMTAASNTIITLRPESVSDKIGFSMGSLAGVDLQQLPVPAFLIFIGLAAAFCLGPGIELFAIGDEAAQGLGLAVDRHRKLTVACAALLASAAVCLCGLLGFVGLIVPNILRLSDRLTVRRKILGCIVWGSILVLACDTLMRTLFYPYELPAGLLLSMIGTPFFILVLMRRGIRGKRHD